MRINDEKTSIVDDCSSCILFTAGYEGEFTAEFTWSKRFQNYLFGSNAFGQLNMPFINDPKLGSPS